MASLFRRNRILCDLRAIRLAIFCMIAVGYLIGSVWIDFRSIPIEMSGVQIGPEKKFAYVFYATDSQYSCYALINAQRLINVQSDPNIDIVIVATDSSGIEKLCPNLQCPFPLDKLKIKMIPHEVSTLTQDLAENTYYKNCYTRFEAFKLYNEYDRIVIMDSDGFIMKNLDHLFQLDMGEFNVAASFAHYLQHPWLSSVLLVVEPSKDLYDLIHQYLNPEGVKKVSEFARGSHYDMDILNYVFETGNKTKILPKYYALLDAYFLDDYHDSASFEEELENTYYLHFTGKKPLLHASDTRPWPMTLNSSDPDFVLPSSNHSSKPEFAHVVYFPFWVAYDKYCRL